MEELQICQRNSHFSVKHLSISLCVYQVNETLVRCISYVVYEVLRSILSAKRYKHLLKRKFRKLIRQSWYYLEIIIIPSFNSSFSSHNQTKLSNQILTLNSSCERLKEICYKYCFHDFSFSTHTHTHTHWDIYRKHLLQTDQWNLFHDFS